MGVLDSIKSNVPWGATVITNSDLKEQIKAYELKNGVSEAESKSEQLLIRDALNFTNDMSEYLSDLRDEAIKNNEDDITKYYLSNQIGMKMFNTHYYIDEEAITKADGIKQENLDQMKALTAYQRLEELIGEKFDQDRVTSYRLISIPSSLMSPTCFTKFWLEVLWKFVKPRVACAKEGLNLRLDGALSKKIFRTFYLVNALMK